MVDSTIARLERAADSGTGVRFVGHSASSAGKPIYVGWDQMHDEARAVGAAFQAKGLVPGDHVAILGPTSRELITVIRGCWMAGMASMVLPLPMRMGSLDAFIKSTQVRVRHGDAKLVLIDPLLADFYKRDADDPPIEPLSSVMPNSSNVPSGDALEIPDHDPERLVILQYSSGSTGEPKGVMIPDRVLSANIDAACERAELHAGEVMVSWLPLYHDMGLVGFLTLPMTKGVDLVQAAPQDFLGHPGNWMRWISDHRGTATAGPNFSWVLATRALKRMYDLDLSSLTLALSGAEPVDPQAVEAFVAEASRFGFQPGSIYPAFGMAEVAIAGSLPKRHVGLQVDVVDRVVLETQRVAKQIEVNDPTDLELTARALPLLGTAVPGLEMKVVDPDTHEEVPERHVGELLLRGTSVTPGYYKRPDATAVLFDGDWLCTGDLAYLLDGQLVLCGRIKDVIIVGGRNVFPEDIERAVGPLDGVRAGNVIAFGMEGYKGKESVVVVAEVRPTNTSGGLEDIRRRIHERTLDVCGLPPRDVMVVLPGSLPKTSSGKLQRSKCRDEYLAEELSLAE